MNIQKPKKTLRGAMTKVGDFWKSKISSRDPGGRLWNIRELRDPTLSSNNDLQTMTTKKPKKTSAKKKTKTATKRVASKTTARKDSKATKKSTTKRGSKAKKLEPVYAEGERSFWVNNGPVLVSLLDLEAALASMDDAQYAFHAKGDQNDFAEWVEYILLDETCARSLRRARSRNGARTAVKRRLTIYMF